MKLLLDSLDGLKIADQKGRITLGSKYAGKRFAVQEGEDGTATLIPVMILAEREQPLTSGGLLQTFASLTALQDNWDGYGSPAPSTAMIAEAREVLALLHAGALARSVRWEPPHISINERGQITLEWWHGERSLTIFIRDVDSVEYLQAWGANIETEMVEGKLNRLADFVALSRWLYEAAPAPAGAKNG